MITTACPQPPGDAYDGKPRVIVIEEELKQLIDNNGKLFRAFQRLIDYECYGLKMWFDECTKEGQEGGETQKHYQFGYNSFVALRQRMLSPEWVLQFLDKEKFDMPEATERIFPAKEPETKSPPQFPTGVWITQGVHSVWDYIGENAVVIDLGMTDNRELSIMICTKTPAQERAQWKKERTFVKRWMILPI